MNLKGFGGNMLYEADEWKNASGEWHVKSVQKLGTASSQWWFPARILDMPLDKFLIMLKEDYHWVPDAAYNDGLNVIGHWDDYSYAHKYKLMINRIARHKKIEI